MTDQWDFYFCNVDDKPASMFVDLGAVEIAPVKSLPVMAYLRLFMMSPRDDGLSSQEEFDALSAVEDQIKTLETEQIAYVGRCTTNSCRDFVFYLNKPDGWEKIISQLMESFPEYKYEAGWQPDPEWGTYLNYLYPSEFDRQRIENRQVCEELEKHGDKLTAEREIDHWIYFGTRESRDAFVLAACNQGFSVRELLDPDDEAQSYGAQIWRNDTPSYAQIDDITIPIFALAKECHGSYDGWETYAVT
jgi:regulator of RNase E activity RraB